MASAGRSTKLAGASRPALSRPAASGRCWRPRRQLVRRAGCAARAASSKLSRRKIEAFEEFAGAPARQRVNVELREVEPEPLPLAHQGRPVGDVEVLAQQSELASEAALGLRPVALAPQLLLQPAARALAVIGQGEHGDHCHALAAGNSMRSPSGP